ncbi:MAG: hypothetical protein FJW40_02085 [Acidobacteria bacterium]|nr:hypothetical protein [Acidobacteriota bacterium]
MKKQGNRLDRALRALAQADDPADASPAVERALLAAYRRRPAAPRTWILVAAAAAVLIAAGLLARSGASYRPKAAAAREVVTEFLPLAGSEQMPPVEGAQIYRVRLPRSALWTVGLPMTEERAHERVDADVLLGPDGVARAIRFVSQSPMARRTVERTQQ